MAYSHQFERDARRQLDETCRESGETVCNRLWNWLLSIKSLAEHNQLDSMTMSFADFLERLATEVDEDVSLPETLSAWRKKTLLDKIRGILYIITKRQNPYQIRVVREDIRFFNVTLDIYIVLEVDRAKEHIIFRKFIGLPIDG